MISAFSASAPQAAPFRLTREEAQRLTGGVWLGAADAVEIRGACIDSRHVTRGCLFACLSGARVDGHDFAETAIGDGAVFILAGRTMKALVPTLVVADVTRALGQLATEFRRRFQGARWIGITGSNGKTTVKELLAAACIAAVGETRVHATRGNLNNHLGVPVTVLNTPEHTAYAVIEMGANHAGEIAYLSAIAQPQVGVITSIGPAHLEGFIDVPGVARAKSELFMALPADGVALAGVADIDAVAASNMCDAATLIATLRANAGQRSLRLIGSAEYPVQGRMHNRDGIDGVDGVELQTAAGSVLVHLLGEHNLANAALAWHAAVVAGVDGSAALRGLGAMTAVAGRLNVRNIGEHTVIDDSYNANPASMVAGLRVLADRPGRRLAILGAMGELGAGAVAAHMEVGREAARLGLPLIVVGTRARALGEGYRSAGGSQVRHADTHGDALILARRMLAEGATTVLVKASRSAGLESIIHGLVENHSC